MTSPHDDVPQEPAWTSPAGTEAPAPHPTPDEPPVYVPPGGYPPVYGQPTAPPAYGQQAPAPGYGQQAPPPGYGQQAPPPGYGQPQSPPPGWVAAPGAPGWGQPMTPPPGASWRPPALQPGIIPLRPIGLGEIYDGAFRAIRANPKVMFGLSAIVVTIAVALQSLITWYVQGLLSAQFTDLAEELDPEGLYGFSSSMSASVAQLSALPITELATTILTGLLIVSVSRSVLGQVVSVRDVLRSGRVWLVVAFSLLVIVAAVVVVGAGVAVVALLGANGYLGLAIVLGLLGSLGYLVVVLWASVRTLLVPPALMLEGKGFGKTVARAWRLTRGSFWRLFGIWLLTSVLSSIIAAIFTAPAQLFTSLFMGDTGGRSFASIAINGIANVIALTLATTFVAAVTALLYIDVRMRREGLDVELARAAEQKA
ncbi:proline-rich domain-containing protein [Cellulomonas sp. URHD0024]|uniref:proline-rich domain-containing protein n=1 Tax=Cellulomonas sp. URHD0024 TaxID=1302620 RepID=UPI0004283DFD|nr:glycerophosphoryl diester phosphodiesterase membrane domain-containing protein [Cellulomonas sp. URHD0024]